MKQDNNDYQEKLSNQIEEISKCIHKNNSSDKEKIQCVIDYINTLTKKTKKTKKTNKITKKNKMNNNAPRVEQKEEIKTEDIPITINTIGLYVDSIKNK